MKQKAGTLLIIGLLFSSLIFSLAAAQSTPLALPPLPLTPVNLAAFSATLNAGDHNAPQAPPPSCNDPYEPNDSQETAWPLTPPEKIDSFICDPQDVDYFEFKVQAGERIQMELYNLPANYDLCLIIPDSPNMLCSQAMGTKPELIEYTAVTAKIATYYALIVGVDGAYDPSESYRLLVELKSPEQPTPTATATSTATATPTETPISCPDPYEPNESFAKARPLPDKGLQAYICYAGDQDWFHFNLAPYQEIRLHLTSSSGAAALPPNYGLELYDPVGRLLATANDQDGEEELLSYIAAGGGVYRARVFGVNGSYDPDRPYTLEPERRDGPVPTATPSPIPVTPRPDCSTDAHESNDTFESATTLPLSTTASGLICPDSDRDYFRFYVDGPSEIEAELTALPEDYQLALINPSGVIVAQAGDTSRTPRTVRYRTPAGGTYRVRIMAGSTGHPTRSYHVRVDLTSLSPLTLYAAADSTISEEYPHSNHGEERRIIVSEDEFGLEQRGLFRFDLADIPAGIPITGATFRASLFDEASGLRNVGLYMATESWAEDTVTWNNQPLAAVFYAETAVGGTVGHYYEWDVTELVEAWTTMGIPNNGFILRAGSGGSDARIFRSREYASLGMFTLPGKGSLRTPRLIISFTEESSGPLGSIAGRVYHDANGDGDRDGGEPGIGDVRVELFRDRVDRGQQMTTSDGTYRFSDLPAGSYEVQVRQSSLLAEWELIDPELQAVSLGAGDHSSGNNFRVDDRPGPTPIPPPTLNLRAADWEFIQVLSGVPLIAGKPTLVRLYVSTNEFAADVSANLYHNRRYDDPLAPIALTDIASSTTTNPRDDALVIADMDRTINFLLPAEWTAPGSHVFHIILNEDEWWRECRDCNVDNQLHRDHVGFRDTDNHDVVMTRLTIDGVASTTPREDTFDHLLRTFPISDIDVHNDSVSLSGIDLTITATDSCGSGWTELLDELDGHEVFASAGDDPPEQYNYGLIDDAVPHVFGGCGRTPGKQAAGIVNPTAGVERGSRTMAHETGHNYGLGHVCSAAVAPPEPGCHDEHPGGSIGPYGLDLIDPANPVYIDPAATQDIMTYDEPRWISDNSFNALLGDFTTSAADRDATVITAVNDKEYLVITGHLLDGVVSMPRPCYRLDFPAGTYDGPGAGPYAIELQDSGGQALFSRHFATAGDTMGGAGSGFFREILPWRAGAERILIRDGNKVLRIIHISPNSPEVKLLAPNGGEHWLANGIYAISWTASDADGDPLRYAIQYSHDNGSTWRAIITDLTETEYMVSAAGLPGGDKALIRVSASDGVNTAQDQSNDSFTVEGKPPYVAIIGPQEPAVIAPGMPVILNGLASDLEDGPIKDAARFIWTSDLEGELGIGRRLFVDDLIPGDHTITLSVSDNDGFTGSSRINLAIGHQIHLPVVSKK